MTVADSTELSMPVEESVCDRLLIVSYSEEGRSLAEILAPAPIEITYTEVASDAQLTISHSSPSWLLLYLDTEAIGPLEVIKAAVNHGATVIVIGPGTSTKMARQCLNRGASQYLASPVSVKRLFSALNIPFSDELGEFNSCGAGTRMTGVTFGSRFSASNRMQQVEREIERVAPTSATVFIQGESGTGKEIVARTIHQRSSRRDKPFIPVNCGAISPQLIESELFGHEKGSFTGAVREHRGVFERANGGTLFLDEITEMPIELQVRLLRVLETHRFNRVGSDRELETDIRVLAATNCCPDVEVREGRFRADLLYRLQVFPILLPPLRDRREDITSLAEGFLTELNEREGCQKRLTEEACAILNEYLWPGNLRELRNVIQRAFIMADRTIGRQELPREIVNPPMSDDLARGPCLKVSVGSSIADVERKLIFATLEECKGRKEKAANILGVSMKTLYNRLRDYHAAGRETAADRL